MKVKVISLMLAILAALSTSVAAHDLCNEMTGETAIEAVTVEEGERVSPLSLICNLLGHSVEEKNDGTYTQTMCVNVGDSKCQAKCYRYKYCTRDNENLGYANTGHHIRNDYWEIASARQNAIGINTVPEITRIWDMQIPAITSVTIIVSAGCGSSMRHLGFTIVLLVING